MNLERNGQIRVEYHTKVYKSNKSEQFHLSSEAQRTMAQLKIIVQLLYKQELRQVGGTRTLHLSVHLFLRSGNREGKQPISLPSSSVHGGWAEHHVARVTSVHRGQFYTNLWLYQGMPTKLRGPLSSFSSSGCSCGPVCARNWCHALFAITPLHVNLCKMDRNQSPTCSDAKKSCQRLAMRWLLTVSIFPWRVDQGFCPTDLQKHASLL